MAVALPSGARAVAAAAAAGVILVAAVAFGAAVLPKGPVSVEQVPAGMVRPHIDAWFVSEVHQRLHSTIVFSRAGTIDPPKEAAGQFTRTFSRRAPIYGRVYLERSLANTPIVSPGVRPVFPQESAYFVRMFVDGKTFDGGAGILFAALKLSSSPQEDRQLTTWRFDLHPPQGEQEPSELGIAWARAVNRL